jgi:hypothetical protein
MRPQLWTRAKGRLATVYVIGFISWMGFVVRFSSSRQHLIYRLRVVGDFPTPSRNRHKTLGTLTGLDLTII